MHFVYWIRNASHTDIFSQGYVGVSNNVVKRWNSHKNSPANYHFSNAIKMYGWDNLVKEVVLVAEEDYCLDIETKLRPNDKIGWNVVAGGGLPPSSKGKVLGAMSEKTKRKISLAKTGCKGTRNGAVTPLEVRQKISETLKGVKHSAQRIENCRLAMTGKKHKQVTCVHCNKTGGLNMMKRWHFDNCKNKGINNVK